MKIESLAVLAELVAANENMEATERMVRKKYTLPSDMAYGQTHSFTIQFPDPDMTAAGQRLFLAWQAARVYLASAVPPPGDPCLDDDGDVTLDWRTADDSLLSISVEPGGRAVYAWHLDSGQRGSGTVDLGYGAHIVLAALHAPLSGQPLPDGRETCKQDEKETGLETK